MVLIPNCLSCEKAQNRVHLKEDSNACLVVKVAEFKRRQAAPVLKITSGSSGMARRMSIGADSVLGLQEIDEQNLQVSFLPNLFFIYSMAIFKEIKFLF
jgi:hypothetical protein